MTVISFRNPTRIFFILLIIGTIYSCSSTSEPIDENEYLAVYEGAARINGPYIVGNYPKTPFLFAVPTSGERPVSWNVNKLPPGLSMDNETGIISGNVESPGKYEVDITAKNNLGQDTKTLTIEIGDELALTPPMGWNSWNTFGEKLSEKLLLETADSLVSLGLRDLGYQYINIDDYWQLAERGEDGHLQINNDKFPRGIKYVADYIHSKGLKLGIYSDAADRTCGGVAGSYSFEETDALDFAEWGVDLLKYDYCHAPDDKATAIERYSAMNRALQTTDRSFIYSVCEWGVREPWIWADSIGGHYWRVSWDIRDKWHSKNYNSKENGVLNILDINAPLADYAGPGKWNDPDMLIVGLKGASHSINHGTAEEMGYGLNKEQYRSHMSLWCMMAAPLLLGNDLRDMTEETKEIIMNSELININQDRLGKQAKRIVNTETYEIWIKQLLDDRWAIACLNKLKEPQKIRFDFKDFDLKSNVEIRDVWAHKNLGTHKDTFSTNVLPFSTNVFTLD